MFATRKALIVVVCLLLVAVAGCNRKVDTNEFLPSSPAFQDALRIVLAALSVPADGSSTVRIEAQISPDADADKRTIRFQTTLGSWVDPSTEEDEGASVDRQADGEGKAAAFLKAAGEAGVALITVSVVGIDAEGFETVLASVSGEVSFTQVEGALDLTVTPSSTFADGVSTIVVEATISDDSPPSWNQVNFTTDAGVFDDGTQERLQVPTDSNRVARVQLTSVAVESGTVTATIEQFPSITVSQLIAFDQRNPDAVRIGTSTNKVPADGATEISVFADIAAGIQNREVTFTTTGGSFVGGTGVDGQTIVATPDASDRATVRLTADTTIKEVLLKAEITLNDGLTVQSSDKLIDFVRALPDFIEVSLSDIPPFTQGTTDSVTVFATLTRNIGDVSPNTVVDYSVTLSNGTPVTDMEFTDVTRSAEDMGVQVSSAVLNWALPTDVGGDPVIVVTAEVGSKSGSTSFQVCDEITCDPLVP
jgi:hypothetical protein